ncbi:helix-hairpin-helix domain-containing protein [Sulfurimonas sp.]|uniref:helix-hairpin-helix domain-containing protein n=1 Tax=Sulfurimonas sp. TaxID=2022749 RepID=UPI002606CBBC|nr:helix-hairpin-helix domain-containing protein [Sulfurimonas sp.]MCW8894424.1 helix-hairpin-helix domain-containing protein [Sulfurimonas sp.]MCW9067724.1 helix-hairpin-helix domain-containing protein [Sulfurimonas sp.]
MKNPNRKTVSKLEHLPNIGKKMAHYLNMAGIQTPQSLIKKDAFDLYAKLCKKIGKKLDPCIIDVFISAIDFMEGGEPKAWWEFTDERKRTFRENVTKIAKKFS